MVVGQAKNRGSFEQRQAEGIAKREQEAIDRAERRKRYEASMTPEQRRTMRKAQAMMAMTLGLGVRTNQRRWCSEV